MHELGIVFYIIRDVEEAVRGAEVSAVQSVTLELGEVSGVVPSYLQHAWRWAADKHDLLRGSELVIEDIPAVTRCNGCGARYGTVEHGCICPACGSENTALEQGQEVMIKEVAVV